MRRRRAPEPPQGRLTVLELDQEGCFVDPDSGKRVNAVAVPAFLKDQFRVRKEETDIFVWVHGWNNDRPTAVAAAQRLFGGIESRYKQNRARYPEIRSFTGRYVVICWPSRSSVLPSGYAKIRERAHAMTTKGEAEYSLAQLLGYLDDQREPPSPASGILQTAGGQYLHCVGHSFGGRFLAEAISAAATPSPRTLSLLPKNKRFKFTVDNFLAFQMAAPPGIFTDRLAALLKEAPLQGPVCLTFSNADRATCRWHRVAEGQPGIGCGGARADDGQVITARLRPVDEDYTPAELTARIVNIDASWCYRAGKWLNPAGAHSDFQHEESYHLLLTLMNFARP
jgi:hypothetical protein